MVTYASKSYQMAGEMFNFAIYTEKAGFTVIGPVLKISQFFGKQKGGPHPALGIRNHPAPSYCHSIV